MDMELAGNLQMRCIEAAKVAGRKGDGTALSSIVGILQRTNWDLTASQDRELRAALLQCAQVAATEGNATSLSMVIAACGTLGLIPSGSSGRVARSKPPKGYNTIPADGPAPPPPPQPSEALRRRSITLDTSEDEDRTRPSMGSMTPYDDVER